LYEDLRRYCTEELVRLDFDGYSVGGLAVDFETRDMWKTVKLMGEILPEDKQRYLMGVGTPDDIIHATKLGMDMFDCVLPTRLARHGSVYIKNDNAYELINLLNSKYREDGGVIDKNCTCPTCMGGFSRAYISHLLRSNEILGLRLATLHNLHQYLELMIEIRKTNYTN
jgi:queuine tRNA-ribosyltransferase